MTGVDRVELAYLRALLADPVPLYALARTRLGYVLLAQEGAAALLQKLGTDSWGRLDLLGRVTRGAVMRRRAEADLRRQALARALPAGWRRCCGAICRPAAAISTPAIPT